MSSGPTGDGVSYWGAIRISGNLTEQDLDDLKAALRKVLEGNINGKPVGGSLEQGAVVSGNNNPLT
jgi:hypothetical protein